MDYLKSFYQTIVHYIFLALPFLTVLPRFYIKFFLILFLLLSFVSIFGDLKKNKFSLKYVGLFCFILFMAYTYIFFGKTGLKSQYDSGLLIFSLAMSLMPFYKDFFSSKLMTNCFYKNVAISTILVGLMSLLQYFGLLPTSDPDSIYTYYNGVAFYRSTALFPHATALGLYFFFVICLLYRVYIKSSQKEWLFLFALFLAFLGLVSTFGRTVLLVSFLFIFMTTVKPLLRKISLKYKMIGFIITVLLIIVSASFSSNEMLKRITYGLEFGGANLQRINEIKLGLGLVKENLLGIGPEKINNIANVYIKEKIESGEYWGFKTWRGVHSHTINLLLYWGVIGTILFYCILFSPFLLYEKNIFAYSFFACLLFFSLYDTFIYTEVSVFLAVIIHIFFFKKENIQNVELKKIYQLIIIIFVAFNLPNLRKFQIYMTEMQRIYIDNPSQITRYIKLDGNEVVIEPDSFIIWTTPNFSLTFEEHDTFVFSYEKAKSSYLLALEDNAEYIIITYNHNKDKNILERHEEDLGFNKKYILYDMPDWVGLYMQQLHKAPESKYEKSFTMVNEDVRLLNLMPQRIWRKSASNKLIRECWEPSWYYLIGDSSKSVCSWKPDRGSYGFSVIRNQYDYIKHILNILNKS